MSEKINKLTELELVKLVLEEKLCPFPDRRLWSTFMADGNEFIEKQRKQRNTLYGRRMWSNFKEACS